ASKGSAGWRGGGPRAAAGRRGRVAAGRRLPAPAGRQEGRADLVHDLGRLVAHHPRGEPQDALPGDPDRVLSPHVGPVRPDLGVLSTVHLDMDLPVLVVPVEVPHAAVRVTSPY